MRERFAQPFSQKIFVSSATNVAENKESKLYRIFYNVPLIRPFTEVSKEVMKNKKVIQLLSCLMFSIGTISGQTVLNIAAGTNITIPSGASGVHNKQEYELRPGFNIACLIIGRNYPKVNFGMEIVYIQNSYQDKSFYGALGGSSAFDTRNTITQVNFSFFVSSMPTKKLPLSFLFGPSFGIPISKTINGSSTNYNGSVSHINYFDGQAKDAEFDLDLRLTGKVLLEFPVKEKMKFTIDNTFSLGLVQPENARRINQRNFYNSLQVGVMFILNKKEHN